MSARDETTSPGEAPPRRVAATVEDGILVITLDNPPVNALAVNSGMVQMLYDAFARGECDPAVAAFVVVGAGGSFCGGAEIKEFGQPYDPGKATVPDLVPFMDALTKPIVAGLHGATMGGGLEIALACHYRVALRGTRLSLPEVRLGVLPGAGGAQRIARLLGAARGLDFVVSGDAVSAEDARALGLVDEVVDDDIRAAAIASARAAIGSGRGLRRTSDLGVALEAPAAEFFAEARARIARDWRGYPAPLALVDCIEAAATRPFAESMALEARLFDQLVMTPASRALRHIFFAERQAAKLAGAAAGVPPLPVRRVAIIGGGTEASALARDLAQAGIAVVQVEAQAWRDAGPAPLPSAGEPGEADLVIVAGGAPVIDRRSAIEILAACRSDTVLAVDTAAGEMAGEIAALWRSGAVVGIHLPRDGARLLEIVRRPQSEDRAAVTMMALGRRLGKAVVLAGGGVIGLAMAAAYLREAERLVDEGVPPDRIDAIMRDFGFAAGPFEMQARADAPPADAPPADASPARHAASPASPPSEPEVVDRLICRLVHEGARLLDAGVARRAGDIDLIWVLGHGFPRYRGGPMFHAAESGLGSVLGKIRALEAVHGEIWRPAPLLVRQADAGTWITG